jgi:type II secretory pathway component GspD/PulD (secretin)
MEKNLRSLSVFCRLIFLLGGVLGAQPKADVIIGVMVMQVNSEHVERLAATTASAGAEGLLNALLTDPNTTVVSRSQLRTSDGMKVRLKIGDRTPYSLTVNITPQTHSAPKLALHVEITESQVSEYINLGGLQQPVISQRRNIADLHLRDREVNLLGRLNQVANSRALSGIPGLVDIPALGRWRFDNLSTAAGDSQLMIAVIPHIVRAPSTAP